eukprot:100362_1
MAQKQSETAKPPIITGDEPKKALNFAGTYIISAISAVTAESCTYPLDVLKTRLQVTKHLHPFEVTRVLFLEEGASKLVLGLDAACLRHVFYSGMRLMLFEYFRDNTPLGRDPIDGSFPLYKSAVCALLSGGIGQFIASPTDFCKVQMQVEGLREIMGQERLYKNTFDCGRSLYRQYGFLGMWSGCIPNVQRGAFIQIGDLMAYDAAKQAILRRTDLADNWVVHGLASVCSGLVATVVCNPFDVVKTRMMNAPNEYRGSFHAFGSIIRNEGFMKLYKGFFPIWGRLGPWNLIFFIVFEKIRKIGGLESY